MRIICSCFVFPSLRYLLFLNQVAAASKGADSYLGFLYAMEEVAVYGYITPLKVKIILALTLTDAIVRDLDVIAVRLSLYVALFSCLFLVEALTSGPMKRLTRYSKLSTLLITSRSPIPFSSFTHPSIHRTIMRRYCMLVARSGNLSGGASTMLRERWRRPPIEYMPPPPVLPLFLCQSCMCVIMGEGSLCCIEASIPCRVLPTL